MAEELLKKEDSGVSIGQQARYNSITIFGLNGRILNWNLKIKGFARYNQLYVYSSHRPVLERSATASEIILSKNRETLSTSHASQDRKTSNPIRKQHSTKTGIIATQTISTGQGSP